MRLQALWSRVLHFSVAHHSPASVQLLASQFLLFWRVRQRAMDVESSGPAPAALPSKASPATPPARPAPRTPPISVSSARAELQSWTPLRVPESSSDSETWSSVRGDESPHHLSSKLARCKAGQQVTPAEELHLQPSI